MGKLIEIESKQFKECNVVMLPTENESGIYKAINGKAINTRKDLFKKRDRWQPIELYITSDDEIKEDDWWLNKDDNSLNNNSSVAHLANNAPSCKKIIATTAKSLTLFNHIHDATLYLPQPSQSFIEKYCELGGIDRVLVEYEEKLTDASINQASTFGMSISDMKSEYKLKTDSHNTITIKPVKNSWTRVEVLALTEDAYTTGYNTCACHETNQGEDISVEQWQNKNL